MQIQMQTPQMAQAPQMVPVYGFAPIAPMTMSEQARPSMPVVQNPAPMHQDTAKEAQKQKRNRKRRASVDKSDTSSSSSEETSKPKRRRHKRKHTVWLHVDGEKIPATYRA